MWRNWADFKYEIADRLFNAQLDEAFRDGQRSGVEYASRVISSAVSNLADVQMTKTQRVGHEASKAAIVEAKKEIMRRTGVAL